MSKDLCTTPIGCATGLETKLVYNTWQPEPFGINSLENRVGVEEFHILFGVPHLETVPYMDLQTNFAQLLADCVDTIKSKYHEHSLDPEHVRIRRSWVSWNDKFAPKSDNVAEYVEASKHLRDVLTNPLGLRDANRHIIWDSNVKVENISWEFNKSPAEKINPNFKYPAVLQAAMNSVYSRHNPNQQRPRFTAEQDEKLLEFCTKYDEMSEVYYAANICSKAASELKKLISRLVSYSGVRMGSSGNKDSLVMKIRSWNKSFLCTIFRNPLPELISVIESKFKLPIHTEEEAAAAVCETGDDEGVVVTRNDFRSLSNVNTLTENCVNAFIDLFNRRDLRICSAYNDKYKNDENFVAQKRSRYVGPSFMKDLFNLSIIRTRKF